VESVRELISDVGRLGRVGGTFVLPDPAPMDGDVIIGSRSVLSKVIFFLAGGLKFDLALRNFINYYYCFCLIFQSRSWLKCELALQKPAEQRANEDIEGEKQNTHKHTYPHTTPTPPSHTQTHTQEHYEVHAAAGNFLHTQTHISTYTTHTQTS
jgi:hypothetical protein